MKTQSPYGEARTEYEGERHVAQYQEPRIQLRLLDGFHLEQDGRELSIPPITRRVVAFLGVRGRFSRAEIAGTLWPEVLDDKALASLRTALWRLRRVADRPLVAGGETLSLTPDVDVDVRTIVAVIRAAADSAVPVSSAPVPTLATMGELLPGWYDDWVLFERERLRQLKLHALESIAERLTAAHRPAEAVEAALAAVRLEPLRESANRALIAAHLAEHNVVEAVRRFESFREGLSSELGVQPSPELERLARSSPGLRPSGVPAGAAGERPPGRRVLS